MKNGKRILSVTLKRMVDDSPDTSWLGEYGQSAKSEYAIDRAHDLDCRVNLGIPETVCEEHIDAKDDECETCKTEWEQQTEDCCTQNGQVPRGEYRYFNGPVENYKGESPEDIRKYVQQDYERMESLNNQNWCFIGIVAKAEIGIPASGGGQTGSRNMLGQTIGSGGLWGIESDSGKEYLTEIEQEQLSELREQLLAIGFSSRAISAAFKNVEHESE